MHITIPVLCLICAPSVVVAARRHIVIEETQSASNVLSEFRSFCPRGIQCKDLPKTHMQDLCLHAKIPLEKWPAVLKSEKCVYGCTIEFLRHQCGRARVLDGPTIPATKEQCQNSFINGVSQALKKYKKNTMLDEYCEDFETFLEIFGRSRYFMWPERELELKDALLAKKWKAVERAAEKQDMENLLVAMSEVKVVKLEVMEAEKSLNIDFTHCSEKNNFLNVLCSSFQDEKLCNSNVDISELSYEDMSCSSANFTIKN